MIKGEQVDLFLFSFFFIINSQGKQHKMLRKRAVATGWLQTICTINLKCVKEKRAILFFIFVLIIMIIIIYSIVN